MAMLQQYRQGKYHKTRMVEIVPSFGELVELNDFEARIGWASPSSGATPLSGDTAATAEIFLRLIPLLAARGFATLEEARNASRRTHEARLRY
jgi:hypothetical protein